MPELTPARGFLAVLAYAALAALIAAVLLLSPDVWAAIQAPIVATWTWLTSLVGL